MIAEILLIALSCLSLFLFSSNFVMSLILSLPRRNARIAAERATAPMHSTVTFIVPVRDEPPEVLDGTLRRLLSVDWPKDMMEVVVVDDSSVENSRRLEEVVRRYTGKLNIKHLRRDRPEGLKAGALNYALRHSSGDYVTVIDVDVRPYENCVKTLMSYAKRFDYVQAKTTFKPMINTITSRAAALIEDLRVGALEHLCKHNPHLSGFSYIVRRRALESIGGWSPGAGRLAEDYDLSIRLRCRGFRGVVVEDVVAESYSAPTYMTFLTQQTRWFYGMIVAYIRNARELLRARGLTVRDKLELTYPITAYLSLIGFGLIQLVPLVSLALGAALRAVEIMFLAAYVIPLLSLISMRRSSGLVNVMKRRASDLLSLTLIYLSISSVLALMPLIYRRWIVTPKEVNKRLMSLSRKSVIVVAALLLYSTLSLAFCIAFNYVIIAPLISVLMLSQLYVLAIVLPNEIQTLKRFQLWLSG